jgi:hypothetical protein
MLRSFSRAAAKALRQGVAGAENASNKLTQASSNAIVWGWTGKQAIPSFLRWHPFRTAYRREPPSNIRLAGHPWRSSS